VWKKCIYWPCNLDLSTPKPCQRSFPISSMNTFSFLSYALEKQTNKQTNRRTRTYYPCRPISSFHVIYSLRNHTEKKSTNQSAKFHTSWTLAVLKKNKHVSRRGVQHWHTTYKKQWHLSSANISRLYSAKYCIRMLQTFRHHDTYRILENTASVKPFWRVCFQPPLILHQLYSISLVHQRLHIHQSCHTTHCRNGNNS